MILILAGLFLVSCAVAAPHVIGAAIAASVSDEDWEGG